jgi:hypothetical protein
MEEIQDTRLGKKEKNRMNNELKSAMACTCNLRAEREHTPR